MSEQHPNNDFFLHHLNKIQEYSCVSFVSVVQKRAMWCFVMKLLVHFFYPHTHTKNKKSLRAYQNNTTTTLFESVGHDTILFYAAGYRTVENRLHKLCFAVTTVHGDTKIYRVCRRCAPILYTGTVLVLLCLYYIVVVQYICMLQNDY